MHAVLKIPNFIVYLFFNFFGNTLIIYMIMIEIQYSGTALILLVNTHAASKQWHHAPQLYQLLSEKKTLRWQLCLTAIQQYE